MSRFQAPCRGERKPENHTNPCAFALNFRVAAFQRIPDMSQPPTTPNYSQLQSTTPNYTQLKMLFYRPPGYLQKPAGRVRKPTEAYRLRKVVRCSDFPPSFTTERLVPPGISSQFKPIQGISRQEPHSVFPTRLTARCGPCIFGVHALS